MAGILRAYQRTLNNYPITVQSIQVGALMGIGDFIAQKFLQEKQQPFNYRRNGNFLLLGTVVVGPAASTWYRILDYNIGGNQAQKALKKVVCDQFIFAPFFLAIFLIMVETLEKKSLDKAQKTMRIYYWDVLKVNWSVWPWVQLGNFYLVPVNYQSLLVQVVALGWNIYLSYKTHATH